MIKLKKGTYMNLFVWSFLIILIEVYFFRDTLFTDKLYGDVGDARLNVLIMEHWFNSFTFKEKVPDLIMFYPLSNTLSYTDMLLGMALPYSLLRFLGIDMFLANKITLILLHSFGSVSLYLLLNRKLKLSNFSATIGVILFSCSNGYFVRIGHTQLFTISFLPFFLYLLILCIENFKTRKRKKYILCLVVYFVMMMYSSFYISYFTFLFGSIFFTVFCFGLVRKGIPAFKCILLFLYHHKIEMLLYLSVLIVTLLPYFMMYIPTSILFGRRSWLEEVLVMAPRIKDFIFVSPQNLLFGKLGDSLNLKNSNFWTELCVGFPVSILLIWFYSIYIVLNKSRKTSVSKKYECIKWYIINALNISIIVSFVLLVRIGDFSLWYLIYRFLPGGSAIRAVSRYNFFLTLPLAIVISAGIDILYKKQKGTIRELISLFLLMLIILSTMNIGNIYAEWSIKDMNTILKRIAVPPENCKIMYILDTSDDSKIAWEYQLDSWMIAENVGVKTINGYSGQTPFDWKELGLYDIKYPLYKKNIFKWCQKYGINQEYVYGYDVNTNQWIK